MRENEKREKRHWTFARSFAKGALTVALAGAMSLAVPAGAAFAEYRGYDDVPADHWAAKTEVIDYAVDRGLLSGYGNGNWGADDLLTRGQLAVIMYRICMPEVPVNTAEFTADADPFNNAYNPVHNTYYHYPMAFAYTQGLIKGNGTYIYRDCDLGASGTVLDQPFESLTNGSDPEIMPNVRGDDYITREELATMLARMQSYLGHDTASQADYAALDSFPDAQGVSSWARDSMAWAVGSGVITGSVNADGTKVLNPQGRATRAEAAKMLMIALEGKGFVPSEHEKHWVSGRVWDCLATYKCAFEFGGCGMTSEESPEAIQHAKWCAFNNGGSAPILTGSTSYRWIYVDTATGQALEVAKYYVSKYGVLAGWYEWN